MIFYMLNVFVDTNVYIADTWDFSFIALSRGVPRMSHHLTWRVRAAADHYVTYIYYCFSLVALTPQLL